MSTTPRTRLERLLGEREVLQRQLKEADKRRTSALADLDELDQAFKIASAVMLATQMETKEFIERAVSLALRTVFGPSYSFTIDYQTKRGQSEAVLLVLKDGEPYSPEDESGGGIVDVTSFGLRLALWALSGQKTAPVFLLDEPARNLSRDRLETFAQMLRELSEMFKVQIIQVSHDPTLIEGSDRAFMVTQRDGVSKVSEIE